MPTRSHSRRAIVSVAAVALVAPLLLAGPATAAPGDLGEVYDTIPAAPLPGNTPSLSYASHSIAEFGQLVILGGTLRELDRIEVGFSSWACEEGFYQLHATDPCITTTPGSGLDHPVTLTIYEEGMASVPGAVLATVTETIRMPHRPSTDFVNCPGTGAYFDPILATCVNGMLFIHSFDFSGLDITMPDRFILTTSWNTRTTGYDPIGAVDPSVDEGYQVLNAAVGGPAPAIGTFSDMSYLSDSGSGLVLTGPEAWGADPYTAQFRIFATLAAAAPDPGLADTGLSDHTATLLAAALALLVIGAALIGVRALGRGENALRG